MTTTKKTVDNTIPNLRKGLAWWKRIAFTNPLIKVGPVRQWPLNFLLHCFPDEYNVISAFYSSITMQFMNAKEREWKAKWKRRQPKGYMLIRKVDMYKIRGLLCELAFYRKRDQAAIDYIEGTKAYWRLQLNRAVAPFMKRWFGGGDY